MAHCDSRVNAPWGASAPRAPTPSLVRYMGVGPAPEREVYLPGPYEELARSLYERGGLARRLRSGDPSPHGSASLEVDVETDERRNVVKLGVRSAGGSPGALARAVQASATRGGATQVDLSLADPRTPATVTQLRSAGFFLGARGEPQSLEALLSKRPPL